jgi:hypothetical protein
MRDVYEAMLPQGTLWNPAPDGDFDRLLQAMGDNAETLYEYLLTLAYIRNPHRTSVLSDLERDFGIVPSLIYDEATRRKRLASVVYATRNTGTDTFLQNRLKAAGFDLSVYPNTPEIDPNPFLEPIYHMVAGGENAYAGHGDAFAGYVVNEAVVNGDAFCQSILYDMVAGGENAFAGCENAVAGHHRELAYSAIEYNAKIEESRWRYVFFVAESRNETGAFLRAKVPRQKRSLLRNIILKYKPLGTWGIVLADFT